MELIQLLIAFCYFIFVRSVPYNDLIYTGSFNFRDLDGIKSKLDNSNFEFVTSNFEERILETIFDQKSPQFYNLTSESLWENNSCMVDTLYFIQQARQERRWAFQVIDSWAKIPSHLLLGNILWPGNYDECRNVSVAGNLTVSIPFFKTEIPAEFQGQYCRAMFVNKTGIIGPIIGANLKAGLNYGFCIPKSCNEALLKPFIELSKFCADLGNGVFLLVHGVKNYETVIKSNDRKKKYWNLNHMDEPSLPSMVTNVIAIMIVLVGLAAVGTFVDYQQRKSHSNLAPIDDASEVLENPPGSSENSVGRAPLLSTSEKKSNVLELAEKVLKCFSVITNGERLLSTTESSFSRQNEPISVLHGLRYLTLAWIILGHTFYFSFALVENPLDLLNPYGHSLMFQSLTQGVYAVDTFFLISGMLVAYNFLGYADKNPDKVEKVLFWIKFYVRRIWRITPTYMLVMGVYIGLWKYAGNGPFWPDDGFEVEHCRKTWWTNLLFINNLVKIPYEGSPFGRQLCMGWSWYLSADMQMFILSPLVLFPIFLGRRRKLWQHVGISVAAAFCLLGLLVTGVLVSVNNLPPNLFPPDPKMIPKAVELQFDVYFKPYPHLCCYFIGMLMGFYVHRMPKNETRVHKALIIFGWTLSAVLCSMVVFGLWPEYRGYIYSPHISALYHATSRLAWAFSVGWVIFVCVFGYGGVINRFLCWKIFLPLSRLTFCAYLIHPMLMYVFYFTRRSTLFYTDFTMVWLFGSFLLFSYIGAFFISLFAELPFLAIGKILWM